jgi:hypothetical protein
LALLNPVRREPSTLVGPIKSVKQYTSEAVSAPYLMRRRHNSTLHVLARERAPGRSGLIARHVDSESHNNAGPEDLP